MSNGAGPGAGQFAYRRGAVATSGAPGSTMPAPAAGNLNMTRAERFEDEKRRIIDSCFSKTDANGQLTESYITHIRVEEDAAFPQSPPPPESTPDNKKARLIIVAVRNSGRVRMYKARENQNGSFSIGKTWNLEDLSVIQSYLNLTPRSPEEAKHKSWAADVGFIVTLSKPYYWQAGTAKEKEFFIASLVKIYRKYTQGKTPELIGFGQREMDVMLGGAGSQPRGPSPGQRPSPGGPRPGENGSPGRNYPRPSPDSTQGPQRFPPPGTPNRPPTSGEDRPSPMRQGLPPPGPQGMAPPNLPGRDPARGVMPRPSMERDLRQPPSRAQMRPMLAKPASSASLQSQNLTPKSSRSDFAPQGLGTSEVPGPGYIPPGRPSQENTRLPIPDPTRQLDIPSQENEIFGPPARERWRQNGMPPPERGPTPGLRPSTAQSTTSSVGTRYEDSIDDRQTNKLPERRRPPMQEPLKNGSQSDVVSQSDYPAPLMSPRRRDMILPANQPSSESLKSSSPDPVPGAFPSSTPSSEPERPPSSSVPTPTSRAESPMVPPVEVAKSTSIDSRIQVTSPETASPASSTQSPSQEEQNYRPGLGPMIKKRDKKEVAAVFKTAVSAYNAFKPRAGGGRDRMLATETKSPTDEPDGITGVVPAPSSLSANTSPTVAGQMPSLDQTLQVNQQSQPGLSDVPAVTVSSPLSPQDPSLVGSKGASGRSPSPDAPRNKSPERPERNRHRRRSNMQVKYLSTLGVDPLILEGRGLEFESLLGEFGWGDTSTQYKKIELLEGDIRRELGRVEAGSWLGNLAQKDDRVEIVQKLLDKTIAECNELEGLLTLYSVELSTLNDDIAFIEAQGQGLQVQTANQKLLHTELQHLVQTISITSEQLEPLRRSSLSRGDGLHAIEVTLRLLYKAMITIEPELRHADVSNPSADNANFPIASAIGNTELSSMRALQEKRNSYLGESGMFLERLRQHLDETFRQSFESTKRTLSHVPISTKLDPGAHDIGRTELWKYSPVLLFAKEISISVWENFMKLYQLRVGTIYQTELRDNVISWKKLARKPTGEEQDLLFTTQEKETEGITSTARKLTVKRSQTLARSLRAAAGDKSSPTEKVQPGRLQPCEAFGGALEEMTPLIFIEQNFIVDLFHASSLETADFADLIATLPPPDERRGTNLYDRKPFEPDRTMAKRVMELMEEIFSFWPGDLQNMVEWAVKTDPLQGVGVLCAIDRRLNGLEDSNQDFLMRTLQKTRERLAGLFSKFVDEQIRAIEDTKVKIKKRKGVIAFMKTFPQFAIAIENMLPASDEPEDLDVRNMIDDAYRRINKAMFESLKVIAKESPAVMASQAQGDPEDKEALNYHILLIENMNHYIEEVDERTDAVLAEWKSKAALEMREHMSLYVDAVIRRPLGKLLEFLESTESLLASVPQGSPNSSIATRSSHSRSIFRKLLSSYDGKEMKRGVEQLKKRVDKHFGDADDPAITRPLIAKVLKECEARFYDTLDRTANIAQEVYEGQVEVEWRKEDITAAFKR